jgi:hypothetical protein
MLVMIEVYSDEKLFFVFPTIALLILLLLLFLLALCARLIIHASPSAVQAQHLAIENANYCSKEHGQPKHYEQDGQDRGPDPESLRIEDNVAELNCGIGEHSLRWFVSRYKQVGTSHCLYEPKGISVTKH